MRRLAIAALCCLPFCVPEYGHASSPPRHVLKMAPPSVCTMKTRMDIFIDEDNILWECVCEAVWSQFACHWQVVAGVDAVNSRKWLRKHPRRVVLYPRVVTG